LRLKDIFGACFAPVAYLMGVPIADVHTVGGLLGEKIVLTNSLPFLI